MGAFPKTNNDRLIRHDLICLGCNKRINTTDGMFDS